MQQVRKPDIVLLLDASGSMLDSRQTTIDAVNHFYKEQQSLSGARLTLLTFDTTTKTIHDSVPLDKLPPLTPNQYHPGGSTALVDAVGHVLETHKTEPGYVVVIAIVTDGDDTSSHLYSLPRVVKMIQDRTAEGWQFHYLGAHPETWNVAQAMSIGRITAFTTTQLPGDPTLQDALSSLSQAITSSCSAGP